MPLTLPLYLAPEHLAQLQASAISDGIIAARGYRTVNGRYQIQTLEPRFTPAQLRKGGGLLIPSYRLGEPEPYTFVYRPDHPRESKPGKPLKYEFPVHVAPILDVLPCYRAALRDPRVEVWITEGAKKADSLASAFGDGIVPVSLNGVYGWRSRVGHGKATATLPDFEAVPWQGRTVVLAYDSDSRFNRQVMDALRRLGTFLAGRGAAVSMLALPHPEAA